MKILYAIQGTGNGHLSRARDIIPLLQSEHELDILISGTQADVDLPFEIKYRFDGLSFVFGKKGGIDLFETYKRSHLKGLFTEINSLPVQEYDLVINDFEPVSAWACYQKNKPCISLSHQAAVLNKKAPRPKNYDFVGKAILKNYAPVDEQYGFHFKAYDTNIFTPVIRKQVRQQVPADKGYYTVYLPAYDDKRIIKVLSACKKVNWQVFSKHNKKPFKEKNISIRPISNDAFIDSMAGSSGVLCGAGFETPAEALFLKKKLMVIPMKGQFEQQCNAAALKEMGVPVIKSLRKKQVDKINNWLATENVIKINYPDNTAAILDMITSQHAPRSSDVLQPGKKVYSLKKFRTLSLKKLVASL
ncbi:glycosyl transferase [Segetibacter sp. 3557_3]|uniref:glycosyltransferase family protein n=1 Tax=Segetibacter sp. 3557_3 TaxID=2547429 RepID=UPI0010591004|nr:glycosyltransferase family protein [Segetibacter sp. 3557_3]TDH23272.1 glycosyl transferase [Segetibacter sp. 3557_3]